MRIPSLVLVDLPPADESLLADLLKDVGADWRIGDVTPPGAGRSRVAVGAADPDAVVARVRDRASAHLRSGRWRLTVAVPDDAEYATDWRPWLTAERIGPIVVAPPWVDVADEPHVLRVDPAGAFGAGAHPSTQHAVHLLIRTVGRGDAVLDVGAGSGILGCVAAHLGARRVVTIDLDSRSAPAVRANALANGVDAIIEHVDAPVEQLDERFDVVVANIESLVLGRLAEPLTGRAVADGTVVLAGLLAGPDASVRAAYGALGWSVVDELSGPDDWRAWVLRRR